MQKRIISAILWPLAAILICGCESGSLSDKGEKPRPGGDRSPTADPSRCVSIKSLNVLKDGKTILSYVTGSTRVLWSLDKGLVANSVPRNFVSSSFDGSYVVGKVSGGRFLVYELSDLSFRPVMQIEAAGNVQFHFDLNSKTLVAHHALPSGADQVDTYDLDSRTRVGSYKAYNIRYVRLAGDGESIVIGYDYGWGKAIGKYNSRTLEEDFLIKLPSYLRFSYLEVSKSAIIAKVRSNFRSYSLSNGDYLGSYRYGSVFSIGPKRDIVLGSSAWGELEVRDVISGEVLYSAAVPESVQLSSCVFSSGKTITCLKRGSNQALEFDFEKGASALSCY